MYLFSNYTNKNWTLEIELKIDGAEALSKVAHLNSCYIEKIQSQDYPQYSLLLYLLTILTFNIKSDVAISFPYPFCKI